MSTTAKTRRTSKTPTMHPTQHDYALALAAYETALAAAHHETTEPGADASDETRAAADLAYEVARARHHVDDLAIALRRAEEAMVADRCAALARVYPARAAEIRETRELARKRPAYWSRVVDLCFRAAV